MRQNPIYCTVKEMCKVIDVFDAKEMCDVSDVFDAKEMCDVSQSSSSGIASEPNYNNESIVTYFGPDCVQYSNVADSRGQEGKFFKAL